jgi:hypothetical protein
MSVPLRLLTLFSIPCIQNLIFESKTKGDSMKLIIFLSTALLAAGEASADAHFCASQVKPSAIKLFALYYNVDLDEAAAVVSDEVTEMPPLKSPDGERDYVVLETDATPGKQGYFRIRMIYAVMGNADPKIDCQLMGEEILNMSSL